MTTQTNEQQEQSAMEHPGFSMFRLMEQDVTNDDGETVKQDASFSFVRPYDPKSEQLAGYRHSVIRFRDTTKGVAVKPAKMVTIPQVTLSDDYLLPELAAKVFLSTIEDVQDSIIRSKVEAGESVVLWSDVTLDACLANATAARVSQRMTKADIENWCKISLKAAFDKRAAEISDSKQHNDADRAKQRAGTENAYVARYAKLAAPVPNIGQEDALAIQKFLQDANLADDMAKALLAKLHAILNPVVVGDDSSSL